MFKCGLREVVQDYESGLGCETHHFSSFAGTVIFSSSGFVSYPEPFMADGSRHDYDLALKLDTFVAPRASRVIVIARSSWIKVQVSTACEVIVLWTGSVWASSRGPLLHGVCVYRDDLEGHLNWAVRLKRPPDEYGAFRNVGTDPSTSTDVTPAPDSSPSSRGHKCMVVTDADTPSHVNAYFTSPSDLRGGPIGYIGSDDTRERLSQLSHNGILPYPVERDARFIQSVERARNDLKKRWMTA